LPGVIWGRNLHVNLSSSAPRGLYHTVTGIPTRGRMVMVCVGPQAVALWSARG